MKKLLQILTTSVVGAVLMGGVAGATASNTTQCDIYQKNSKSYNSCLNNLTKTSVKVVCVNNVYVIDNNSQNAGTGSATFTSNGSGGYAASGNATNQSGTTVTIGASCGKAAGSSTSTSTPPSKPGSSSSSASTTPKPSTPSSTTTMSAASLPETGSNTVVNAAVIGTALVVSGLALSFVGTALYRRAALK